jgi:hypothetical protein
VKSRVVQRGETPTAEPVAAPGAVGTGLDARERSLAVPRRGGDRLLVLVTGLAAALPVLVAIVHQLWVDWVPLGDDAIIGVRSFETLSSDPPLVGMPAGGATGVLHEQAYHLGPLLFWLLSVPARWLHPSLLPVTVGILNVACVVGIVAIARRRGGRALMFVVAAGLALTLSSIPAAAHAAVWNPAAAFLPFTLLIFAAWSIACGEYRLLPVAVLAASFAAQCHLTYVVPSLTALLVGAVGLAVAWRQGRLAPGRPGVWVAIAALVAVVCWSAPVIQQLTEDPGNFTVLRRAAAASDPKLGSKVGQRAVAHAIGVAPWWVDSPRGALKRIGELSVSPGAVRTVSTVAVLAALAALGMLGLRRRRPDVVAACALSLALVAALGVAASSVPKTAFGTVGYSLWWASAVGLFAWLTMGWSAATLFALGRRLPSLSRPVLAAAAGVAVIAAVGVVVAADANRHDEPIDQMRTVSDRLQAALPAGRAVRVDAPHPTDVFSAAGFQLGIVYAMRRDGRDVQAPSVARYLGDRYRRDDSVNPAIVNVDVDRAPTRGSRVVARVSFDDRDPDNPFSTAPPTRVVTVSLPPAAAAP